MLHQIGVGALGPVFRTYEPTRDRLVAVKVFRLDVTPEQASALADELGRAADASLFHPSIVEPVAAGIEGTVAYRAEEYVAAESLDVAMRHYAPATAEKALPFITQLASAIDFARAAGVGHGALHPRDIFVTPDEARATGFGVVDALERQGLRAPVRRPYSPPERIAGQPWGTPADVFSLAVIAYELLTGRRPSGLGEEMGLLESTTGSSIGERADKVRAVLARATLMNPLERYATAQEFSAALAHAAGVTETAVPVTPRIAATPVAPPEETGPRIAPLEPVPGVSSDLSLAPPSPTLEPAKDIALADAATVVEAAAPDDALNDFAMEPEAPSPTDSPREVARKVIAAREVRKRQVKKKDPSALFETVEAAEAPAIEASPPAVEPSLEAAEPPPGLEDVAVVEAPVLEAIEAAPQVQEPLDRQILSDRVVAVDEFRAREVSAPKLDRGWPRVSERAGFDRVPVERTLLDRGERSGAILESPVDRLAGEIPPSAFDGAGTDRQRTPMLPLALMLCVGLVIGYALGQFRLSSVATAPEVPPATADKQTPTTGNVPATATTVDVRPPVAPPAVPSEDPPRVAATPPAKASAPSSPAAPPRAAGKLPAAGRLVVMSSPPRAGVTINGKWSGRTPLTLNELQFGNYVVRVVEKGFEVARSQFELSPGDASHTVDVTLRPLKPVASQPTSSQSTPPPVAQKPPAAAATGGIYVDSRPRGARVFINGKEVGVTPLTLTAQVPGPRDVRLELADHQAWTTTTSIVGGSVARVTGSLDRIR